MVKAMGGQLPRLGSVTPRGPWMLTERSGLGLRDVGLLGPAVGPVPRVTHKQIKSPCGVWKGWWVGLSEVRGGGEACGLRELLNCCVPPAGH